MDWQTVNHFPQLTSNSVYVWKFDIDSFNSRTDFFYTKLSGEEKNRADRFITIQLQKRFIIAHGVVRFLLAKYLNKKPADVEFTYNGNGKPAAINSELRFNLSHSNNLALLALNLNQFIGVDVEFMKHNVENNDIAQRFFSALEIEALQKVSLENRRSAFFNCWTRKEAFIKALGVGLSYSLKRFDVEVGDGDNSLLLAVRDDKIKLDEWSLVALPLPNDDYVGALAVNRVDYALNSFTITKQIFDSIFGESI